MCAATILTRRVLVSAAHCFNDRYRDTDWFVRVGDNFMATRDPSEQTFQVKWRQIIISKSVTTLWLRAWRWTIDSYWLENEDAWLTFGTWEKKFLLQSQTISDCRLVWLWSTRSSFLWVVPGVMVGMTLLCSTSEPELGEEYHLTSMSVQPVYPLLTPSWRGKIDYQWWSVMINDDQYLNKMILTDTDHRWSGEHCEISGWGMQEYNNTNSYPDSVRAAKIAVNTISTYYHLRQHEIVVRYSPPPATNDFTITQQYSTMIHATTTHHSQPSYWWTFVCGRWWHQCCFTSARC